MPDVIIDGLNPRDLHLIRKTAREAGVSAEIMALAFLQAHLVLIRDCAAVFSANPYATASSRAVSLGGGKRNA